MMTRKHFVKTAEILNGRIKTCLAQIDGVSIPGLVHESMRPEYLQLESLAEEFADWFAEENPAFDRDVFMKAVHL